jgi:hypothetical protein
MLQIKLISSLFVFIWLGLGALSYLPLGISNWFTFVSLACASLSLVSFVAAHITEETY